MWRIILVCSLIGLITFIAEITLVWTVLEGRSFIKDTIIVLYIIFIISGLVFGVLELFKKK